MLCFNNRRHEHRGAAGEAPRDWAGLQAYHWDGGGAVGLDTLSWCCRQNGASEEAIYT